MQQTIEVVTIPVKEFEERLEELFSSKVMDMLLQLNHSLTTKPLTSEDEVLMKRTDVAELFNVSLPTVHAWMKNGTIPFHRIGGRTYFKKYEVVHAMKQVKVKRKLFS